MLHTSNWDVTGVTTLDVISVLMSMSVRIGVVGEVVSSATVVVGVGVRADTGVKTREGVVARLSVGVGANVDADAGVGARVGVEVGSLNNSCAKVR